MRLILSRNGNECCGDNLNFEKERCRIILLLTNLMDYLCCYYLLMVMKMMKWFWNIVQEEFEKGIEEVKSFYIDFLF